MAAYLEDVLVSDIVEKCNVSDFLINNKVNLDICETDLRSKQHQIPMESKISKTIAILVLCEKLKPTTWNLN